MSWRWISEKGAVRRESLLHLVGAELERLQQVAMPALEVM